MVLQADFVGTRPLISFQHVWKKYPNGTEALRDITLTVPEGDFLFLVGPSGAGKSSLIRLLIREEKPTKGKIFVDGQELGRMKRRHLPYYRRKVGLVFQDFKLLPLFLQINHQAKATVLMATHNRDIVDLLRRRVIAIDGGQVVRDDRASGYHEALAASGLRA